MGKTKFNPPINEFISVYEKLKSSVKVGEYYGVDHHTIIDFAKRNNYNYRIRDIITEEQKEYIINNYEVKTSEQLSHELGINSNTIYGIWTRNGLNGKQRRIYSINEHILDNIDTEEKAYFLGFFAADGCVSKNKHKQDTITFSLLKEDSYIPEKFYKLFGTNKEVKIYDKYAYFEISSDYLCNKIYDLGFTPRKTYSNTICLLEDDKLMKHFIRGYFDGDGSISNQAILNKTVLCISGYEDNMNKLIEYLKSIHITAEFSWDKRKKYINTDKKFGSLILTNKLNKYCFLKYIYDNSSIYLIRKKDKADQFIKEIEKLERITHIDIVNYYKYAVQKVS